MLYTDVESQCDKLVSVSSRLGELGQWEHSPGAVLQPVLD